MNVQESFRDGIRKIEDAFQRQKDELKDENTRISSQLSKTEEHNVLLNREIANLKKELKAMGDRNQSLVEEQAMLVKEKAELNGELSKCQSQLNKLYAFKRTIINSINDEDLHAGNTPRRTQDPFDSLGLSYRATRRPSMEIPISPTMRESVFSREQPSSPSRRLFNAEESPAMVPEAKDVFAQMKEALSYSSFTTILQIVREINQGNITKEEAIVSASNILRDYPVLFESFKKIIRSITV
ncbi:hypothetical protein PCE1_004795 [Barthelona sp. PCE]